MPQTGAPRPKRKPNDAGHEDGGFYNMNCCQEYEKCPSNARACLQERLFRTNEDYFIDDFLGEQKKQLKSVVEQCISCGESNSVLVIGPRGTGKSKLVQSIMCEMHDKYSDNYISVYLSGIVHTDDRLALNEMTRQLELENVVGDRVFGSFSDNLSFLLDSFNNQNNNEAKSIIIIIDEFDCFTAHKNQSLLYNLFDIAQSKQSPLCVIGITCRLDVIELLEKRVKSRYSHRLIITFPSYSFSDYISIIRRLLILPDSFPCSYFKRKWDQSIKVLLEKMSINDLLERHFSMQKDIGNAIRLFVIPVSSVSYFHPMITEDDIKVSYSTIHKDTKAGVLRGLSILELCLVVAAQHVNERRDGQPFNFEMVYNEYQTFARRRLQGMQHFTKAVTFKAYEHLESLELIKQSDKSLSSLAKEYKPMFMLIDPSQIHGTLEKYPGCPTELKNWAEYVYT